MFHSSQNELHVCLFICCFPRCEGKVFIIPLKCPLFHQSVHYSTPITPCHHFLCGCQGEASQESHYSPFTAFLCVSNAVWPPSYFLLNNFSTSKTSKTSKHQQQQNSVLSCCWLVLNPSCFSLHLSIPLLTPSYACPM